jgi:DNA mismatch repair protein MutL
LSTEGTREANHTVSAMAHRIRVLDEQVINRIAAGEVIERPVSVVKELVENAIDAHAGSIRIDVEHGGRKLIRVRDNGSGMSRDDAFLALERHATSKLETERDLVGIATMGFRGEALASIAAVSKLRLVTKEASEDEGTEIIIEGGSLRNSQSIGCGDGTVIEVRNLFYNVPVRMKFLRKPDYEEADIREFILRICLAFPDIGFTYSHDGKVKLDSPPVKSTFERLHALYSKDVSDNLAEVDYRVQEVTLSGYVAKPPYFRSNMRSILTFVNGRSVRDRLINSALTRAFANLMERGRYPLAILFIQVPPDQVDVNVHPQKAEVRFAKPKVIQELILEGIQSALMGAPFRSMQQDWRQKRVFPTPAETFAEEAPRQREERPEVRSQATSEYQPPNGAIKPVRQAQETLPEPRTGGYASLGILGRLPGSFLVLYNEEELVILDHHAAHERALFERLLNADHRNTSPEIQSLLVPVVLSFGPAEAKALAAHAELIRKAGFIVEEFGEGDFVVKGVPVWFGSGDLERFFSDLTEVMLETGGRGDSQRMREELLKRMACSAAVKETQKMMLEEIRALLEELDAAQVPDVCPHGRPLTVRLPYAEIRKRMGRR